MTAKVSRQGMAGTAGIAAPNGTAAARAKAHVSCVIGNRPQIALRYAGALHYKHAARWQGSQGRCLRAPDKVRPRRGYRPSRYDAAAEQRYPAAD